MEKQLKSLQLCVYIILVFTVVNTIALFASLKDPAEEGSNLDSTQTEESYTYDVSMFEQVDMDGYNKALKEDKLQVVYLGRATCGYCVQFIPILQTAQEEYGYTTLYVDTDSITSEELSKILETMDVEKSSFGTPTTAIIKNGKVLDVNVGYVDYNTFVSFLESNGFKAE